MFWGRGRMRKCGWENVDQIKNIRASADIYWFLQKINRVSCHQNQWFFDLYFFLLLLIDASTEQIRKSDWSLFFFKSFPSKNIVFLCTPLIYSCLFKLFSWCHVKIVTKQIFNTADLGIEILWNFFNSTLRYVFGNFWKHWLTSSVSRWKKSAIFRGSVIFSKKF